MKVDIIGSFLPPTALAEAKRLYAADAMDADTYRNIENKAVDDLINSELNAGLAEVTSGEFRRQYWDKDFYFGLKGLAKERLDSGRVYAEDNVLTDLLRVKGHIAANPEHPFYKDFAYLQKAVNGRAVCRQTLPSPGELYVRILSMNRGKSDSLYPDTEQLLADITDAYRDTIRHFYDMGCRSLQLDDTVFGRISTDAYTKDLLMGGIDVMALQEVLIALTNACIDNVPADMHISIFISGGDTIVPAWQNVDYADDVIPKVLSRIKVAQFYLPFDGKHAKQLNALRFVPAGKQVALGLIDAHTPWAYYSDRILGCIEAAQRYVAPELLSVTPKTGFKLSKYSEKGLDYSDQWRKLQDLHALVDNI